MARLNTLSAFVQREIFYLGVVVFDVLALGVLLLHGPGPKPAESPDVARRLAELGNLFSLPFLKSALHLKPFLVVGLGAFLAALVLATVIGAVLLAYAGANAFRGRPFMKQQPLHMTRWGLWDVFKIAAMYPFFLVCGVSLLAVLLPLRTLSPGGELMVNLAANAFAFVATLLSLWHVVRVERGQSLRELGYTLTGTSDLRRALACYAAFLPLLIAASQITQMVTTGLGLKTRIQDAIPIFVGEQSAAATIAMIALACLIAPVAEETFFRGFLQPVLRRSLGQRGAIIMVALLFALVHRNLAVFLPIFALGLVLGYLYEKTQSTIASAVAHCMHNAVTTCFLLIIKELPVPDGRYTIV
jgi:membrane protease YdiL (CAAX protease family)